MFNFVGPSDADATVISRTLRTEAGGGQGLWVARSAVSVPSGIQTHRQWLATSHVYETILRIRKLPPPGISMDKWLREIASETLQSRSQDGLSGTFGCLRGHLFEHMDILDYNLRRGGVYRMEQLANPNHLLYDAIRFHGSGKFAGAVQYKSSATAIGKAIKKVEAKKSGSASRATFRVPKDQATNCKKAAGRKTRVQASRLTTKSVNKTAKKGLLDLKAHGKAATSLPRQVAKAAGRSAVMSIAVGGMVDLSDLRHGKLNARQYLALRSCDGVEAGITAAATTTTIASVTAGATLLTSAPTAGTLVAGLAGTVAASTVVMPAVVGIAVGYGVSRAAKPVRRYLSQRLHDLADDN